MKKDEIIMILKKNGYTIESDSRAGNNYGDVLRLSNGSVVNCYDKGTHNVQGKNCDEIKKILMNDSERNNTPENNNVFVVYGHDEIAKTQLEALLRRWDLEPIIFDQIVSSGKTIIEKLEDNINKVSFGIVVATPDDIGYPKKDEKNKKYRARQNVVLELGMLLARLGRERISILLSTAEEDMEKPSDIDGLIYIPFKENVEEAKLSLAKEMNRNGFNIDIEKL